MTVIFDLWNSICNKTLIIVMMIIDNQKRFIFSLVAVSVFTQWWQILRRCRHAAVFIKYVDNDYILELIGTTVQFKN